MCGSSTAEPWERYEIPASIKTGKHDDLVTAISLAVQKPRTGWGSI
jgi:hypothetical protein